MTSSELIPLLRSSGEGVFVPCHVQPGASRTRISGIYGDRIKIALAAPPVDGKANKELCQFLAKLASLPKSAAVLTAGMTSRDKVVFLPGVTAEAVVKALCNE